MINPKLFCGWAIDFKNRKSPAINADFFSFAKNGNAPKQLHLSTETHPG